MNSSEVTIGSTVKKKFFMVLFAGLLLFGILLSTLGFTGTVFALPLGGMGDFYVTFDKLEGEGFTLNPKIGETGMEDAVPMVRNEIDTATIDKLHIYKDIQMPTGNWIRVNIKANQPTEIEGLTQDAQFIDATLAFEDMGIKEANTSGMSVEEAFEKNWSHDATTVTITDATIVTDYLFQNMVTLNDAVISIDKIKAPKQIESVNKNEGVAIGADNKDGGGPEAGDSSDNKGGAAKVTSKGESGNLDGGFLPQTASNWLLPIFIGAFLILIGGVIIAKMRRKTILNES